MSRFAVWARNCFPSMRELMPVYAVALSILNFWMVDRFFWKFPSWIYFLKTSDLLATLAYAFATTFAESLVVILGLAIAAAVMPRAWFRDAFVARGAALVLLGLGYVMIFALQFQSKSDYPTAMVKMTPWVLTGIAAIAYFVGRVPVTRHLLESLADRFIILLYIFLPLSIIGIVTMILRNMP